MNKKKIKILSIVSLVCIVAFLFFFFLKAIPVPVKDLNKPLNNCDPKIIGSNCQYGTSLYFTSIGYELEMSNYKMFFSSISFFLIPIFIAFSLLTGEGKEEEFENL